MTVVGSRPPCLSATALRGLVLLGLAVLIGVVYANALSAGFVLDNRVLILENPTLRTATWHNVATIFTHDYWHPAAVNGLYRPLTTLSYLVNYSVLGNADRPLGYHLVNLVLHWGCSALCFALMRALGAVPLCAALAAALVAVHPITTEAVTNIVGRADLFAALAVLAGLVCHIRATASQGAQRRLWLVLLALVALLGVFAKENAAVLLPLIITWEVCGRHPSGRDSARPSTSFVRRLGATTLILIGIVGLMASVATWVRANEWVAPSSALDNPILTAGVWPGRATALGVIGVQICQLLWPQVLSADYSYNQIPIVAWPPDGSTVAAWITVAGLAGGAIWLRRGQPSIAFLLAFFFIALLPTANLVVAIGSIRADRFLYLPLVGFAGALALSLWTLARGASGRRVVAAALVVVIVACGGRTILRNRDWASDDTLWTSTVAVVPHSAKAQKAYAATLMARGNVDLERVIAHAERAVAIRPDYLPALIDLGGYEVLHGNQLTTAEQADRARQAYAHATAMLRRARALDRRDNRTFQRDMAARGRPRSTVPERGSAELYRTLGLAHLGLEQVDRALPAYHYARRLDPWAVQTYLDISALHAMRADWNAAAATLFEAIMLDRSNRDAWTRLIEIYRIIEPAGPSVLADGAGTVTVDDEAPSVMRHRCRADAELSRLFSRARLPEVARAARQRAAKCRDAGWANEPGFGYDM